MDTEELIRKCKAISIQEGSERKLSIRSEMKEKRRTNSGKLASKEDFNSKKYTHGRN